MINPPNQNSLTATMKNELKEIKIGDKETNDNLLLVNVTEKQLLLCSKLETANQTWDQSQVAL